MGNIRLYGSTSGYTELAPPAVAPDGVLALPSGTGTLLKAEGGKVLQIVRATDTTARTTTSGTYVDASISITITPQKNDSTILLIWHYNIEHPSAAYTYAAITDNSNNLITGGTNPLETGSGTAVSTPRSNVTHITLATPATTSPVTFKGRYHSNGVGTARINNDNHTGQLYAIEVSA